MKRKFYFWEECMNLREVKLISKELGVFAREILCVRCKTFLRFTCIVLFSGQSIMRQGIKYASQRLDTFACVHTLPFCSSVLDSLAIELKASKHFSKLYAGIAILWLHLSLSQPSFVYSFLIFFDLFSLINER
ncbi:hypothetical protein ES332_A07G142700v1 [Gossypium tomentosum]|uniref:Uncharacterized protein n=1 Tax=Gossypium tomentosum TaxID=34277 RepID=A0A5D2PVD4_GOSTO|nr:hypothetical protein ES332_A07G142700v1 [Gossypium tomentosum]